MASHLLGDFNPIWTLYSRKGSSLLLQKMNKSILKTWSAALTTLPIPFPPFPPFPRLETGQKVRELAFTLSGELGRATQGLENSWYPLNSWKIPLCSNYVSSVDNWYWLIIDPIFPHEFNWKKCWSYFARNSDSNVFLAEISLYTSWPEKNNGEFFHAGMLSSPLTQGCVYKSHRLCTAFFECKT